MDKTKQNQPDNRPQPTAGNETVRGTRLVQNNQNSLQNVEICRNRTAMVVTPTGLVDYSILQSQNSKFDQPLKSLLVRRLQF